MIPWKYLLNLLKIGNFNCFIQHFIARDKLLIKIVFNQGNTSSSAQTLSLAMCLGNSNHNSQGKYAIPAIGPELNTCKTNALTTEQFHWLIYLQNLKFRDFQKKDPTRRVLYSDISLSQQGTFYITVLYKDKKVFVFDKHLGIFRIFWITTIKYILKFVIITDI